MGIVRSISIGTSAQKIIKFFEGFEVDFIIQNLSANNVYFGCTDQVSATEGIKITPGSFLSKDDWQDDGYIIADGATSDVRYATQSKRISTTEGPIIPVPPVPLPDPIGITP
jgi:hypothetical protein